MDLEDNQLLTEIGEATQVQGQAKSAAIGLRWRRRVLKAALALVSAGTVYAAYRQPLDSYPQALLIESGAGLALFLAVAPVLRAARHHRTLVVVGVLILSPVLAIAGNLSSGVARSLFVDAAVGSLFVVALDLMIDRWLAAVSRAESAARAKLKEAGERIERADSYLDYKYAVHDYLGLPRPDQIGGMAIPEGQLFLNWIASGDWPEKKAAGEGTDAT